MANEVAGHMDTRLKDYVLSGIRKGFRVGYDKCKLVKENLWSALEHPTLFVHVIHRSRMCRGMATGPLQPTLFTSSPSKPVWGYSQEHTGPLVLNIRPSLTRGK